MKRESEEVEGAYITCRFDVDEFAKGMFVRIYREYCGYRVYFTSADGSSR